MLKKLYDFFFKPRLLFLAPKEDKDVKISKSKIALRLIVAIITAVWIGFLPIYLFILYMHQNKFFSYDFFIEGFFGMTVFIVVTVIVLILISLILYGFLIVGKIGLIKAKRKKSFFSYRVATYFLFIFSLLMHLYIFDIAFYRNELSFFYALITISFLLCLLFLTFVGHGLKRSIQNWLAPLLFVFFTAFLPFAFQDTASLIVSLGLKSFNIGGGKDAAIKRHGVDISIKGKLLLLSPSNVYLKNGKDRLLIVPISEHTNIEIW